jgi:hypothetical protein
LFYGVQGEDIIGVVLYLYTRIAFLSLFPWSYNHNINFIVNVGFMVGYGYFVGGDDV